MIFGYNEFFISYNIDENKVYIKSKCKCDSVVTIFKWDTTTDELSEIYTTNSTFDNDTFWYSTDKNLHELNGIKVEIKEKNNTIKEEFFRFRTRYGDPVNKIALLVQNHVGIGDNLTVTPAIKKMYNIHNQKITLFTYLPEIFINNPYVEKTIKITRGDGESIEDIPNHYFNEYKILPVLQIIAHWRAVDHRQVSAWNLGFELTKDEMKMEFYPDTYQNIPKLPKEFICINPSVTNLDRTWGTEKWQQLVNLLEKHIPIVAIGKTTHYDKVVQKTFSNLKITNGLNLLNHKSQESLSQAYHIINKSKSFVTMNNGLYILSLCTDVHITELSTSWNTEDNFRIRDGIKNKNITFCDGDCKLHCISDLKTAINETGKVNILKSGVCYLNKPTFECHPTPDSVYEKMLKII